MYGLNVAITGAMYRDNGKFKWFPAQPSQRSANEIVPAKANNQPAVQDYGQQASTRITWFGVVTVRVPAGLLQIDFHVAGDRRALKVLGLEVDAREFHGLFLRQWAIKSSRQKKRRDDFSVFSAIPKNLKKGKIMAD